MYCSLQAAPALGVMLQCRDAGLSLSVLHAGHAGAERAMSACRAASWGPYAAALHLPITRDVQVARHAPYVLSRSSQQPASAVSCASRSSLARGSVTPAPTARGLAARSAPKAGTSKSGHSSPVTHKGRGNGIVMREKGVRCLQTQSLRATSSDGQCIMLSGRLPPPPHEAHRTACPGCDRLIS